MSRILAESNASLAGLTHVVFLVRSKVPIAPFREERAPSSTFSRLEVVSIFEEQDYHEKVMRQAHCLCTTNKDERCWEMSFSKNTGGLGVTGTPHPWQLGNRITHSVNDYPPLCPIFMRPGQRALCNSNNVVQGITLRFPKVTDCAVSLA